MIVVFSALRIHISEPTYKVLKQLNAGYEMTKRGEMSVKVSIITNSTWFKNIYTAFAGQKLDEATSFATIVYGKKHIEQRSNKGDMI